VAALALVMLALAIVQAQRYLLRWRATRLLADFHQIRLYQSTWADAQRMMRRWGAWGSYDGTCSAQDCRYRIVLADLSYQSGKWIDWFAAHRGFKVYNLLGGRSVRLVASFTVHNGSIWRESSGIAVSANRLGIGTARTITR